MEEIWRIVEENPDYLISNRNGWINTKSKKKEQPYGTIERGYRYVSIGRKHPRKPYHVLVAKAFPEICGDWFEGAVVHHKDGNKLNNVPENLEVLTKTAHVKKHYKTAPDSFKKPSEKRSKSISNVKKGKMPPRCVIESARKANIGSRHKERQKPIIQYTLDGKFVRRWDCAFDIKKEKGWSDNYICDCCKHKPHSKTSHGYKWEYEKETDK